MRSHRYLLELWLLFAFGVCFVGILGCNTSVSQTESVQLHPVALKQMYDFGIVRPSTINRHTFRFQNPYQSAIKIVQLSASCGCVRPSISTRRLEVGEALDLEVAFAAMGVGDERQNVTIVLEDQPPKEFPTFEIFAKVRDDMYVVPQRLLCDIVDFANMEKSTIRVENHSGIEWSNIRVVAPDWIRAEIQQDRSGPAVLNEARQSWTVGIFLDRSQLDTGSNSANVKIIAQPHAQFENELPVAVSIQEPFVVLPKKLILSQAENKHVRAEARIYLGSQTQQLHNEEVLVSSSHNQLQVQVRGSEHGEWLIVVSAPEEVILEEGESIFVHIPALSNKSVSIPILTHNEPRVSK